MKESLSEKVSFLLDPELRDQLEKYADSLPLTQGRGRPSKMSEGVREALRAFFSQPAKFESTPLAESEITLIRALRSLDQADPELTDSIIILAQAACADEEIAKLLLQLKSCTLAFQKRIREAGIRSVGGKTHRKG